MGPVGQVGQEAHLVPAAVSEALAENMWWLGLESSEGLFSHISGTWTKITAKSRVADLCVGRGDSCALYTWLTFSQHGNLRKVTWKLRVANANIPPNKTEVASPFMTQPEK